MTRRVITQLGSGDYRLRFSSGDGFSPVHVTGVEITKFSGDKHTGTGYVNLVGKDGSRHTTNIEVYARRKGTDRKAPFDIDITLDASAYAGDQFIATPVGQIREGDDYSQRRRSAKGALRKDAKVYLENHPELFSSLVYWPNLMGRR